MDDGQRCQAFTVHNERCQKLAKHTHETPGDAVYLCNVHYRMIKRRMRLGSDEEFVRKWRSML